MDKHPYAAFEELVQGDPEYAWALHSNIAMPLMDFVAQRFPTFGHQEANEAAAMLMLYLWNVDVTKHPHWVYPMSDIRPVSLCGDMAEALS